MDFLHSRFGGPESRYTGVASSIQFGDPERVFDLAPEDEVSHWVSAADDVYSVLSFGGILTCRGPSIRHVEVKSIGEHASESLIFGDLILIRSFDSLTAFDRRSFELSWSRSNDDLGNFIGSKLDRFAWADFRILAWQESLGRVSIVSSEEVISLDAMTGDFLVRGKCGSGNGFCYTRYNAFGDEDPVKNCIEVDFQYPEFREPDTLTSTQPPGFTILPEGYEVAIQGDSRWVNSQSLVSVSESDTVYVTFPERRLFRVKFFEDKPEIVAESEPMQPFSSRIALTGDGHFGVCRSGGIDFYELDSLVQVASWSRDEPTSQFGKVEPFGLHGALLVCDGPYLRVVSPTGECLNTHRIADINPTKVFLTEKLLYAEAIAPSDRNRSIWRLPVYSN